MTEFPETKSEILVRIQTAEDQEAWAQFVSPYRPVIYRLACRRGMQNADAQEVVQLVLMSVGNSIKRWERLSGVRFRHWLRKVIKNTTLNVLSRKPIDLALGGTDAQDLFNEEIEQNPGHEDEFEFEARREIFQQAAAIVQAEVRGNTWEAFQLSVIDGLSVEDAAHKLGISTGGVYAARGRVMARLNSAVNQLKKELD
ncbi:MAG: RNA polymerase sigma factor [Planctomycetota bacterium]